MEKVRIEIDLSDRSQIEQMLQEPEIYSKFFSGLITSLLTDPGMSLTDGVFYADDYMTIIGTWYD
jgi:hypothetical protein